jgi:dUTP pyrophosphatase
VIELHRNPPVGGDLAERIVDLWTTVANAGGAVGFLPDATREEIRPVAAAAFERVAQGHDDLVLALDGRAPVGFGFLVGRELRLTRHVGTVSRLMRHPRLRGRGLGGAVLRGLEEAAADRGMALVTLSVRGDSGRQRYYAAHGYRIDARLPARLRVAGGRLVEEIIMSKPLTEDAARAATALRVRRLDPGLPLPAYAHPGDAGLDLRAAESLELKPGERASVPTGLAVAVPPGCVGLVHPRSGLAARHGVAIVNAPGTIDAGYRGEVRVLLVNLDPAESVRIERGERIAQLVIQRVEQVDVVEVDTLDTTPRGEGGFGSTGR